MPAAKKESSVIAADVVSSILNELRQLPAQTTPMVRALRRRYSKEMAAASPDLVLAVARLLFAEMTWPSRVVACELLLGHPGAMSRLNERLIEEMAAGLSDWGSVDVFGVTVAGTAWREQRITDDQVMRWARAKDRWRRRLALVSTVALNSKARGGTGDAKRTLAVCHALVDDRDDMVVKALSWALRELAKHDPGTVAAFLRHQEKRLASRVRREVRTKLETGRKVR